MELLFMVCMVVVSVMALFAVMVVFRDIVLETFAARRERERADAQLVQQAERIVALANEREARAALTPIPLAAVPEPQPVVPQPAPAPQPEPEPAPEVVAPEPVVEAVVEEEPVKEEIIEEVIEDEAVEETEPAELCEAQEAIAVTPEDMTGKISFSKGTQLTLEEKYLALTSEQKGWYDAIVKHALAVEGSKRFKNARYEEYKVGKNRLVRMLIKRGVIQCEFILHNSDFKNYVNENKIAVKQSATTMLVENAATVQAVKNSIDIVLDAIAEEKEYKKKLAREKRKAARAGAKASAEE